MKTTTVELDIIDVDILIKGLNRYYIDKVVGFEGDRKTNYEKTSEKIKNALKALRK